MPCLLQYFSNCMQYITYILYKNSPQRIFKLAQSTVNASISENATIQFSNVSKDYSKGPQGAGIISSFLQLVGMKCWLTSTLVIEICPLRPLITIKLHDCECRLWSNNTFKILWYHLSTSYSSFFTKSLDGKKTTPRGNSCKTSPKIQTYWHKMFTSKTKKVQIRSNWGCYGTINLNEMIQ